jgi:hypothetical protein
MGGHNEEANKQGNRNISYFYSTWNTIIGECHIGLAHSAPLYPMLWQ